MNAPPGRRRTAARLAAVQALYQIELTQSEPRQVIEEFLAGSGESRGVMAAHQSGVRFLPLDGQPLQLLEHRRVDQRLNHCG